MADYGQYCPVAKAMEVLDERWTILVVRELLLGSRHFNELRRGLPRMSPTLLTKRLRRLERAGVVKRADDLGRSHYALTPQGAELWDVVQALSRWGTRWIGELGEGDLDPHLLLWDIRRTIGVDTWPRTRTTVEIDFRDVAGRAARWWVVVEAGEVALCDYNPGYEVTAQVATDLRTLTEVWRGDLDWAGALSTGRMTISGAPDVRTAVPHWIGQGFSAQVPRPTKAEPGQDGSTTGNVVAGVSPSS